MFLKFWKYSQNKLPFYFDKSLGFNQDLGNRLIIRQSNQLYIQRYNFTSKIWIKCSCGAFTLVFFKFSFSDEKAAYKSWNVLPICNKCSELTLIAKILSAWIKSSYIILLIIMNLIY